MLDALRSWRRVYTRLFSPSGLKSLPIISPGSIFRGSAYSDTSLQECLKFSWEHIVERGVQQFLIIHVLDEIRNSSLNIVQSAMCPEVDLLGFNGLMKLSAKALSYGLPFRDMLMLISWLLSTWTRN